jgi:hypothetical protein
MHCSTRRAAGIDIRTCCRQSRHKRVRFRLVQSAGTSQVTYCCQPYAIAGLSPNNRQVGFRDRDKIQQVQNSYIDQRRITSTRPRGISIGSKDKAQKKQEYRPRQCTTRRLSQVSSTQKTNRNEVTSIVTSITGSKGCYLESNRTYRACRRADRFDGLLNFDSGQFRACTDNVFTDLERDGSLCRDDVFKLSENSLRGRFNACVVELGEFWS